MAELVGMDVTHTGPLGHCFDIAMNSPPVEGLAVVAVDEST